VRVCVCLLCVSVSVCACVCERAGWCVGREVGCVCVCVCLCRAMPTPMLRCDRIRACSRIRPTNQPFHPNPSIQFMQEVIRVTHAPSSSSSSSSPLTSTTTSSSTITTSSDSASSSSNNNNNNSGGGGAGPPAAAAAAAAADGSGGSGPEILLAGYSRKALGQTGDGHFSPIGGYHRGRDLVLLMDVARFKCALVSYRVCYLWGGGLSVCLCVC
jgi:hypothetical protein